MLDKRKAIFALVLILAACTGQEPRNEPEPESALGNSVKKVETETVETVKAPLGDLNLVHARVPAVLLAAQKEPYAVPSDQGCDALAAEVRELDAVLGADLDALPTRSNPGLLERGGAIVTDAAAGAVKSAIQVAVPYRSWVRKLSGAEKYSREVAAAIAAGGVRRAFLKGFRQARGCPLAMAAKETKPGQ